MTLASKTEKCLYNYEFHVRFDYVGHTHEVTLIRYTPGKLIAFLENHLYIERNLSSYNIPCRGHANTFAFDGKILIRKKKKLPYETSFKLEDIGEESSFHQKRHGMKIFSACQ